MAAWNFQDLAGSRFGRCTVSEQNRNTTRTVMVKYGGEVMVLAAAVEKFGVSRHVMSKYRVTETA